ncbi:MAG: hypothetical protein QGH66_00930 [Dehalococcoidia bacterium]|nr:hypothetical protein [Dehalococcoidia bacterium]
MVVIKLCLAAENETAAAATLSARRARNSLRRAGRRVLGTQKITVPNHSVKDCPSRLTDNTPGCYTPCQLNIAIEEAVPVTG